MAQTECDTCQYEDFECNDFPCSMCGNKAPFDYWQAKVGEEPTPQKPPLGVIPEKLWLEARVKDLSEAIARNVGENWQQSASYAAEMMRHMNLLAEMD